MENDFVYYGYVDIYDDIFTEERLYEWKKHIVNSYKVVRDVLRQKIDPDSPIEFCVNYSLLKEVIVDAVIGMKKITDSSFNSVENPNAFKVAAYLSYWWLRHKPVCVYYPAYFELDDVNIYTRDKMDEKKLDEEQKKLAWQLKHINELVAVQLVSTYIFDFDNQVCTQRRCDKIKRKDGANFSFENFDQMMEVFLRKLTYYFSYRAIAPKMIEHMLEAYTFHPAWGLTGVQWSIEKEE